MADIFLSYTKEDRAVAANMVKVLAAQGWSIFWDREIPIGMSWDEVLDEQLPLAKIITPLWSPRSVKSRWVKTEADFGIEHEKLLPAMIESTAIPISFRLVQYADLTIWDGASGNNDEIVRLLNAIKKRIGDATGNAAGTESYEDRPPFRESGSSTTKIFLGYARSDGFVAEQLVIALREHGFAAWWDPEIPIGATFENTIIQALNSAQVVVVVWSPEGTRSAWVRAEAQWALNRGNLVSVVVQNTSLPAGFGSAPTIDLASWNGSSADPNFDLLLKAISRMAGEKPTLSTRNRQQQRGTFRQPIPIVVIIVTALLLGCAIGLVFSRIWR